MTWAAGDPAQKEMRERLETLFVRERFRRAQGATAP
jgi:hypothetical protein